MQPLLDLQNPVGWAAAPPEPRLAEWIGAALEIADWEQGNPELTVRLVSEDESAALNQRYRDKAGPTNVLSFPAEVPAEISLPLLGDLVICIATVESEAASQHKEIEQHLCHLVVHGTLHLLGYDHQVEDQAQIMETMETQILFNLGFPDPYRPENTDY